MTKEAEDNTQKELHALYQHIEQEQPSKALDNAILELAASHAKPRVKSQSFWRKHRWPLSSAASVLLVVTLFVINPQMQTGNLSDEAMPALMSTPQEHNAPAVMRMATPEQESGKISAQESTRADETAQIKLQSSDFNGANKLKNVGTDTKALIAEFDEIEKMLTLEEFAQAEQALQQIESEYGTQLQSNEALQNRFNKLQKQLDDPRE
ncbi:Conserved hypothetical protein [Shewanella piezotolerans WP3]|uniref:Uncharacterized protein n=1 Tax=Shewanella piezotolerans (strain WP3 / JCM 13877) TaxID=225849 RepID=B8CJT7_SHEPW|nr:hypothetical protein [Shewanella piezotolerans]ACJ28184.1 Conserved hypothetical protein [Shewanella piezotolerans WP3]